MISWIVGAAVVVLVYVVYRASRGSGAAPPGPPSQERILERTLVILGTPGNPTVSDPGPLRGQRGDRVTWHIDNRTGGEVDVWIKNFKRKGTATKDDPLQGPEADRRKNSNGPTPVSISDVIKGSPAARQFKYDVHLNGQEALDPDLEVMN